MREAKTHRCALPAEAGPLLSAGQIRTLMGVLERGWHVVDGHHLERTFEFPDFHEAMEFANAVGFLAECEGHHPEIHMGRGHVRLELWSHDAGGLTKSDFVLATEIDHGA